MTRLIDDETFAVLTIWMEARGEPQSGKVAVAEVIRRRMARRYKSDGTVVGTVLRPFQFSGWNSNDPNRLKAALAVAEDPAIVACRAAWRESIDSNVTNGALDYLNKGAVRSMPDWVAASREVAVVGSHTFYVPQDWPATIRPI